MSQGELVLNRSWLRLLALVMVFGLVAAACGSDSSDDESAPLIESFNPANGELIAAAGYWFRAPRPTEEMLPLKM